MPLPPHADPSCPFCAIATSQPPTSTSPPPSPPSSPPPQTADPNPPAYILLSTPLILAFLDHAPITRGHVLLATRQHRSKLSDISVEEGAALGAWLPLVSRAVVRAVEGEKGKGRGRGMEKGDGSRNSSNLGQNGDEDEGGDEDEYGYGDWNVVQNNGARAAQVVPHVHFHIIPRPELESGAEGNGKNKGKGTNKAVPAIENRSWTVFGRGLREDLDEGEADELVADMRGCLASEVLLLKQREGEEGLRGLMGLGGVGEGDEEGRTRKREGGESKL